MPCGVGVETALCWSDFKAVSSACFNQAYGGFPTCIKGLFLALIFRFYVLALKNRQLNLLKNVVYTFSFKSQG